MATHMLLLCADYFANTNETRFFIAFSQRTRKFRPPSQESMKDEEEQCD